MMEFLWKRTSLLSLRLIWKTSLQMLSRLFPLTASCREKHKKTCILILYLGSQAVHMARWLSSRHPHTGNSQRGRARRCAGWAEQSRRQWGGTAFEVSPTSSCSSGRACLLLPGRCGDYRTGHTGGPQRPQQSLSSQEKGLREVRKTVIPQFQHPQSKRSQSVLAGPYSHMCMLIWVFCGMHVQFPCTHLQNGCSLHR